MPTQFEIMLFPEKYGYQQCPHCNGYGSSLKESSRLCTLCRGTGLIKQPTESARERAAESA